MDGAITETRQTAEASERERDGWLTVLAAFFGVLTGFGTVVVFTFGVFLKPVAAEYGWTRESVSRGFGIAALAVAAASPVLGRLLDRYGPRRVILPCYAIYAAALASLSLLTARLAHFYAIFAVLGLAGNATTQMGYSRAVSTWFLRRRGLALALVMCGTGAGAIAIPALAQRLIDSQGWRSAYVMLGALAFLCGIPLTALFVKERPRSGVTLGSTETAEAGAADGLRSRAFWTLVATLVLSSVTANGTITHLAALLTDRGLSGRSAALTLSILGASSLCGRLITGPLLDRFFGPRVSFCLLGLVAAGIALLAQARTPGEAAAAAILVGVGFGGEADVTPYLLTRYFGLRAFSTLYGFTWTAYAVAGAVGPVLMGRAFDLTGSYGAFLLVLAGATLLAGLLALTMPRYPEPARAR